MGESQLDPEQEAEMREELLEFTECMRDHGIDMPDPVFGDDGRVTMEATPGERVGPGVEDEAFRAASEACGREGPAPVLGGGASATRARTGEGLAACSPARRSPSPAPVSPPLP